MTAVLRLVAFLLARTARNRFLAQLRRLRQPRYLVAVAAGLLWWWFYVGRFVGLRGHGLSPEALPLAELAIALVGLVLVTMYWLFGSDRAAVEFSEAEIQLLFPAPLSRRQLLHYRLLRSLATSFFAAAVTALLFGRGLSRHPALFALGSWVAFSTLSFHGVGAALTRASLAEHGLSGLRRRLVTLAVVAAGVALVAGSMARVDLPAFEPTREGFAAVAAAVDTSLLGAVLWPFRAPVRLALAPSAGAFLAALPGALAVFAVHYAWVVSSTVQFEEAALDASERLARRVEAARANEGLPPVVSRRRRPPFRLGAHGAPEVALLWKGLIAASRGLSLRLLVPLSLSVGLAAVLVTQASGDVRVGVGIGAVTLWLIVLLTGPRLLRADLRRDLKNLDALKALPLPGSRLVRGSLLPPLAVLTLAQWGLLPFAAAGVVAAWEAGGRDVPVLPMALVAAIGGPAVTLALLTIQNGMAILLPAWSGAGERPRGPEAVGMNLLASIGSLVALAVAAIPAAAVAFVVGIAAGLVAGAGVAAVAATVAGAAVIALEAHAATALLGRAFERMEVTDL